MAEVSCVCKSNPGNPEVSLAHDCKETFNANIKTKKQPTLLVVVLHSDDVSSGGSCTGQDGRGIQGLDGERVNHSDVLS